MAADPSDRWSRLALARNERKLGQFDQALETLASLAESDPEARAYRVEVATDRGDFDEVQRLLAVGPEDHALLSRLRGGLALRRAEGDLAVKLYRRSNSLEPDHPATVYGLAEALRLSGEAQAALEWKRRSDAHRKLREIMITREQNRTAPLMLSCELGALAETAGLLRQARAWYGLAIRLDPLDSTARQALFRLKSSAAGEK